MPARWPGVLCSICILAITLVFCNPPANAQTETATVRGRITDPAGALVPNATVRLIDIDRGTKNEAASDDSGFYGFANVLPGRYRIEVEKSGFKLVHLTGITVNVQDNLEENFKLDVGAVSESVTVEAGGVNLNTTDASVSTVVDHTYVENMPLNGRSVQDLILLTPGVVTNNPQTQAGTSGKGEFSVNGQRTESNYYTVDGVSANLGVVAGNVTTAANSGSLPAATALGTTQSLLSMDAMEEFRVQTSTYSAEYGRTPGGQFSFVTRSGTNQWHGTAFDYLRNDVFDANDWFNNYLGRPKAPLRQNDFGGTLGGPVRIPYLYDGKDRTFFFFSYEGLRLVQPQAASVALVPSMSLRANTPAPLKQVLNAFPVPNGTDLGNGLAQFVSNWSNPGNIDSTSIRIDHALNERLRLFLRFSNAPSFSKVRNTGAPSAQVSLPTGSRTYTLGATSSFSSQLSNDLRLNYSSSNTSSVVTIGNFGGATPLDLVALQGFGTDSTAQVSISFIFGGQSTGLNQFNTPSKQRQWNLVDTLGVSLGEHRLKFGVDFRRLTPILTPPSPGLFYRYSSVGAVRSNSGASLSTSTSASAYPIYANFSAFAQDEWKLTSRLGLSMGLRWEVNPAPGAPNGNLPYTAQGNSLSTFTLPPQGTPLWKTTWYNFAPRLGAAYVVRNKSGWETIVRGGGGVFFDTGQQLGSLGYSGPGFLAQNSFPSVSFPLSNAQAIPILINPPTVPYPVTVAFSPHLQLPFTLEWNASIQQALGKSQALTVTYVGANGRRLLQGQRVNISVINPNFQSQLSFVSNGLTSWYNALEVQFQRRLARGLQALASYTWSHSIDYGSQNAEFPYVRGNSDFDVRDNFSGALSYDLPTRFQNSPSRVVLHHWGLDGRFTARTGFPVTLNGNLAFDPVTDQLFHGGLNLVPGQPLYVYGSACTALYNNGKGCPGGRAINPLAFALPAAGQIGNAPRNFARGFGVWQIDVAARREFPISERVKLQFRAEAFNVFNHPNFGTIIGVTSPAYCDPTKTNGCTFGQATGTLARGLGGLSPLYQMGGPRSMQFALRLVF